MEEHFLEDKDFLEIKLKDQQLEIDEIYLLSQNTLLNISQKENFFKLDLDIFSNYYLGDKFLKFPDSINNKNEEILILIFLGGFLSNENNEFKNNLKYSYNEEILTHRNKINSYKDYFLFFYKLKINEFLSRNNYQEFEISFFKDFGIIFSEDFSKKLKKIILDKFNKLFLIIAPGDNLWFKSNKKIINNENYGRKYDGQEIFVFFNTEFFRIFKDVIGNDERLELGFISTLNEHNLYYNFCQLLKTNESLEYKKLENSYLFCEYDHDCIENEIDNQKYFLRNLNKIIRKLDFDFKIDQKNILILDSEKEKSENVKDNTIFLKIFNEEVIDDKLLERKVNKYFEKLLTYIKSILDDDKNIDIKNYLNEMPLNLDE